MCALSSFRVQIYYSYGQLRGSLINAADQLVGSSSSLQLHCDGAQCNDRLYIDLVFEHFIVISNPDHNPVMRNSIRLELAECQGQRPVRENSGAAQPETATSSDDPPSPQPHALLP